MSLPPNWLLPSTGGCLLSCAVGCPSARRRRARSRQPSLCYDARMAGAPADGARWAALAGRALARTAMGFQSQSARAVSALLIDQLHISTADLGWLIGLFSLPGIFFSLPGGLFGTRFGDRRVVLTGLALMAAGSALMGSAESFATMAIDRKSTRLNSSHLGS